MAERSQKRWRWLLYAAVILVLGLVAVWLVPASRSTILFTLGRYGPFAAELRADLLTKSVVASDGRNIGQVCDAMFEDPEKSFSLVVLDYLWDERITAVHREMHQWLENTTIAWPRDSRQIRRCDLAAGYFRRYIGQKTFDEAQWLAVEVSERDTFRDRVRQFIEQNGLPPAS